MTAPVTNRPRRPTAPRYYYLVLWPQRKKRLEAAKWARLREAGDTSII